MTDDLMARVPAVLLRYAEQAGVGRHEHGRDPCAVGAVRLLVDHTPIVSLDSW